MTFTYDPAGNWTDGTAFNPLADSRSPFARRLEASASAIARDRIEAVPRLARAIHDLTNQSDRKARAA